MLSLEKLRLAVAGVSITYPLREATPRPKRMAHKATRSLPNNTMQDTPQQNDFFPTAPTFDGVKDKLDTPYAPELNPASSFTVEVWVMVQKGSDYQCIIASVGGSPLEGRKGYLFCITPSRQWQFWLGSGEPRAPWKILTGPMARLRDWTHLAGSYDVNSRAMTFYINGQEVGRHLGVEYQPNDRNPLRVGASASEQWGASPCYFGGKIAEFHVWDRVLSNTEIQALSAQQTIDIQAEPVIENAPDSADIGQDNYWNETQPAPESNYPAPEVFGQGANVVPEMGSMFYESNIEKPITRSPEPGQDITPTASDAQTVLWQIGKPGQAGISAPTGEWQEVYDYRIGTDTDPINRPTIPSCLVPPNTNTIPNSTSRLNIYFILEEDYAEGQLVLYYDRYGSGEDNVFLDEQLILKTPGAGNGKLKQSQIPLEAIAQGSHTVSITVSNSADGTHLIEYLQLQTFKPMMSNHPSQHPGTPAPHPQGTHPGSQKPPSQGNQGPSGLLGGLPGPASGLAGPGMGALGPATGLIGGLPGALPGRGNTGHEAVGQGIGGAGNPAAGLIGSATGLVGGLTGAATGAVGQAMGGAGNPADLLGSATGMLGGIAGTATGALDPLTSVLGQVPGLGGLVSGLNGLISAGPLIMQLVTQSGQLISDVNAAISTITQIMQKLGIGNQAQQVPEMGHQGSPGSGGLSPQQLAQLLAAVHQIPGMAHQGSPGSDGLSPQQFAILLAAVQQASGQLAQQHGLYR